MLIQVTQEKRQEWESKLTYGDKGKMGLSSPIVWQAFKKGMATQKTIDTIDKYFEQKQSEVKA